MGATAFLALVSLAFRYRVEQSNHAVGICLDMLAVQEVAAAAAVPTSEALERLKAEGLTGVVLPEQTVSELQQAGRASIWPGANPDMMGLTVPKEEAERVESCLKLRFGDRVKGKLRNGIETLSIRASAETLRAASVGINPVDASRIRKAGLVVIARHANEPGASQAYVYGMLKRSKDLGATAVLPLGEQMLGQGKLIEGVGQTMGELGLVYASPEFAKIGGDAIIKEKSPEVVVRLHAAQQAEADKMTPAELVERYSRAYRERNIRWLLVRTPTSSSDEPLANVGELLSDIGKAVIRAGGTLEEPHPYKEPGVPKVLFPLLALAAAPIIFWTLRKLWDDELGVGCLSLLTGLLAIACWGATARPLMAFAIALFFPVAAYLYLQELEQVHGLREYAVLTAVCLLGGLAVAGLLNDLHYVIQAHQFLGVKAAHFAPIAVAGFLLLRERVKINEFLASPMLWGTWLLGLVLLVVLIFMIARTGNDNPEAVSGFELKLRSILDTVLFTRPRTKEFLIGDPALFVGLSMLAWSKLNKVSKGFDAATAVLLTVGAIGLTSVLNTMCHTHTPLTLSIIRIATGWVLGGLIGAAIWALVRVRLSPVPEEQG